MDFKKIFQKEKPEGAFVEDRLRVRHVQKRTTIGLLLGVSIIGWSYVFLFSDIFVIQRIEVEGLRTLERGEVVSETESVLERMRIWPLKSKNLLFIDTDDVSDALSDKIFAQSITVDKKYPNILRLIIKERQTSLVILKGGRYWQIDRNGTIMREITEADEKALIQAQIESPVADQESALPILEVSSDDDPIVGNTYVTDFRVSMWLDTFKSLQDLGFGYRHATVEYATSTKLILKMFEPYDVYIDIMEPVDPQIRTYYEFLRIKKGVQVKKYVDVRVAGKVYYQ